MRSTKQMSVTLPSPWRGTSAPGSHLAITQAKVRLSVKDCALQARDRALDRWLREDVAEAYVAVKADPSRLLSSDDLKVSIAGILYGGQDYETILADDDAP